MTTNNTNEFSAFEAFNLGSLSLAEAEKVSVYNWNLLVEAEERLTDLYHASAPKAEISRAYARVVRLQDRNTEIHNFIVDYLIPEDNHLHQTISALRAGR